MTQSSSNIISVNQIIIPSHHRQVKPWVLREVTESIKDHGYNPAYPITVEDNTLVDGRHRLEAARACGLTQIPFVNKPEGISTIRHSIQCNQDQTLGTAHDVFDYAELCYGLAKDGMKGEEIAGELGWSKDLVSKHGLIKSRLHPLAWNLARCLSTKNSDIVYGQDPSLVDTKSTIVDWSESHFRSLLSCLSLNGKAFLIPFWGPVQGKGAAVEYDFVVTNKFIGYITSHTQVTMFPNNS